MRRNRRSKNVRLWTWIGVLSCIFVFSIGYAMLSSNLIIRGTSQILTQFDVYIASITPTVMHHAESVEADVLNDGVHANFKINLNQPGSYGEYRVVVKNDSTFPVALKEITGLESSNRDILFSVEGLSTDEVLYPKEVKEFTIRVSFDIRATSLPQDSITFELGMLYEQVVNENLYDEVLLQLDYTGFLENPPEGSFTMQLINEEGEVVATANNSQNGQIVIGQNELPNFSSSGQYRFYIRLQETMLGGVSYVGASEWKVDFIVRKTTSGLSTKVSYPDTKIPPIATILYEASPTSVTLGASLVYSGAVLKENQFTFILKDKEGREISRSNNTAAGQVAFPTLNYNEVGTYSYVIEQLIKEEPNITYDTTKYNVSVVITDNNEGSLLAEVTYQNGRAPVFQNEYHRVIGQ